MATESSWGVHDAQKLPDGLELEYSKEVGLCTRGQLGDDQSGDNYAQPLRLFREDSPYCDGITMSLKLSSSLPSTPSSWSDDDEGSSWDGPWDANGDSGPEQKRCKMATHRRLPENHHSFLDFREVSVDKTECIRQLPDVFRYLLLRPPRFGKTAFLSILEQYYDIHGADQFNEHFRSLTMTGTPDSIPNHNQHLCLSFGFSSVHTESDITKLASNLKSEIELTLGLFLIQYATELKVSDPDTVITHEDDRLPAVFKLVRARGYTLFVGVDDYDALARSQSHSTNTSFLGVQDVQRLLDSCFWAPLLAASDIIDKLLITGILPVDSPALESLRLLGLSDAGSLQLSCGFTEQETLDFARSVLDEAIDMAEFRQSCGEYVFSSHHPPDDPPQPVLHPQRAIARISELAMRRP
ncbi:hypothetical protein DFH07DRAFT_776199 [Mycena maculata]|uniref:AAA-ATPase-like domain-containing protein n=1 Tax=Mycena maculata TaxID=230809 RepID=A0AAD7N5V5_9AGAR|nr:hypothetical protein DFH07DRAFT_776199 [Mycena maculata]